MAHTRRPPKPEPALTPHEWRAFKAHRAGEPTAIRIRAPISAAWTDGVRHAIAAQCLYRKPFGFRKGDPALLVEAARRVDDPETGERLFELALRIAALLPPTNEDGDLTDSAA